MSLFQQTKINYNFSYCLTKFIAGEVSNVLVFSGDSVTLSGNHLPGHDSSGSLHLTQLKSY